MKIININQLKKGDKIRLSKDYYNIDRFYCERVKKKFRDNYGVDISEIKLNVDLIAYGDVRTSFESRYGKEYYNFSFEKFKFETIIKYKYKQFLN